MTYNSEIYRSNCERSSASYRCVSDKAFSHLRVTGILTARCLVDWQNGGHKQLCAACCLQYCNDDIGVPCEVALYCCSGLRTEVNGTSITTVAYSAGFGEGEPSCWSFPAHSSISMHTLFILVTWLWTHYFSHVAVNEYTIASVNS